MGRGRQLAVAAIGLTAVAGVLAGLGGAPQGGGGGGERPNVVVVMTDDQDLRSLDVMRTVRRRLQARGTTFENFFATFPLCCPSRATFLTGQYAHNHGVLSNPRRDGGFAAFHDRATLAVALQQAGYRTALVGKYLNGYQGSEAGYVPPGWSAWRVGVSDGYFRFDVSRRGRVKSLRGRSNYRTDVEADAAVAFIRRSISAREPFFLELATHAPHGAWHRPPAPAPRDRDAVGRASPPRPPSFNEKDISDKPSFVRSPRLDRDARARLRVWNRKRLASLLAVDDAVRRIVAMLKRRGELSETYVVFTSDNGYLLGEHRLTGKTLLYEESARVPLIVRGPDVPEGVVRRQLTGNIDLAPTILDAAGVAPLRPVDGTSLLPLAADPSAAEDRALLLENRMSTAVRTPLYMYAEHDLDGDEIPDEFELYDMSADSDQLENRYGDPGLESITSKLEERLDQLRDCAGSEC